jgi:DNA-binding transcriptional ArsR family regulator
MLNCKALDSAFQALGDPTRLALMERLAAGSATVSELARPLPMSLPAVMLHLRILEESGLVRSEKTGRVRTCRIAPAMLSRAEQWIGERRRMWELSLDRLGALVEAAETEGEKT